MEVLLARTWLPDGSTLPVEAKAINVITLPELTGAAIYADIKQKVISFGGIQPGAVVELVTRTVSLPDSADKLDERVYWDMEMFRSSEPILRKRYELLLPDGMAAPLVARRNGLDETETGQVSLAGGNYTQYGWELSDVPMIQRIPNMPPAQSYAPWLLLSNVDSWEDLGRWLARRFYPSVVTEWRRSSCGRTRLWRLRHQSGQCAGNRHLCCQRGAQYQPFPGADILRAYLLRQGTGQHGTATALIKPCCWSACWARWGSNPGLHTAAGIWRTCWLRTSGGRAQFDRPVVYVQGFISDSTLVNRCSATRVATVCGCIPRPSTTVTAISTAARATERWW